LTRQFSAFALAHIQPGSDHRVPGRGLTVAGAPFFLGEPENNGWDTPATVGSRTVRVEVFVDDPDGFIGRAVAAGADGSADKIRDHQAPRGIHRQGGFTDPFGHLWLVGDRSPLGTYDLR